MAEQRNAWREQMAGGGRRRKKNRHRVSWRNLYTAASLQGESKGMPS